MASTQRRPMSEALRTGNLSPEGLAFVRGALPSAASMSSEPAKPVEISKATPAVESDSRPAPRTMKGHSAAASARHPVLVGLSTRVDADLHDSLMRASFE